MKNTIDNTPKIAIFNMSNHGMNSDFDKFVRSLSRTGHELVACGDTAGHIRGLNLSVTETGKLITRDCGFSKVTVAVLDRHVPQMKYLRQKGGTEVVLVEDLIYDLLDNDPPAALITHQEQYIWLTKKLANVYGVRSKDKDWLAVKASVMFNFEQGQVLNLLEKIRPKEPQIAPAW